MANTCGIQMRNFKIFKSSYRPLEASLILHRLQDGGVGDILEPRGSRCFKCSAVLVSILHHTEKQDKPSVNQHEEIKVSGERQVCG